MGKFLADIFRDEACDAALRLSELIHSRYVAWYRVLYVLCTYVTFSISITVHLPTLYNALAYNDNLDITFNFMRSNII